MLKERRVIGHITFHLANTKNRTGIVTHFISKPTNQGSIEVCGKAVNRGRGLGVEIPCVYIFDGPRKDVDLLEQLLDVSNNPAIRAEDDHGTARSQQTTLKRKKVKSNDCNKKPRK